MSAFLRPVGLSGSGIWIAGAIAWIGAGLSFGFLDTDVDRRLQALSILTLSLGVWIFLRNGGRAVTTAGVFGLCVAIFVGFAGLHWLEEPVLHDYIADAVGVAYFSLVTMYYLFWRGLGPAPKLGPIRRRSLHGGVLIGMVLMGGGAVGTRLGIGDTLAAPAAFTGAVLISATIVLGGRRNRKLWVLLVSAGAALFYVRFVFVGYGRLVLAALAFSVLIIVALRFRTYWIKILSISITPFVMSALIEQREEFGVEQYGQALDGIGSVVAPLEQFAVLLRDVDNLSLHWLDTFFAAAVTHVPRPLWPGKPDGFGLVLAEEYDPVLAAIGGTYAALAHGEWIYAFGLPGILLMTLTFGWAVNHLDRALYRLTRRGVDSRRALLAFVTLALVAGGVSDMIWGGSHTFMGRTGTRLLIVAAIAVVWGGWLLRRKKTTRPALGPGTTQDVALIRRARRNDDLDGHGVGRVRGLEQQTIGAERRGADDSHRLCGGDN